MNCDHIEDMKNCCQACKDNCDKIKDLAEACEKCGCCKTKKVGPKNKKKRTYKAEKTAGHAGHADTQS